MIRFFNETFAMFFESLKNIIPVLVVIAIYWILFADEMPENILSMAVGVVMAAIGIALFLQGLDMGIFPLGRTLSNEIASKGSMWLLLFFGFSMGFGVVIAEPSLIVVAQEAEMVTGGQINALTLRIVTAISVGLILMMGLFRVVVGHSIKWYMIGSYLLLIPLTFMTPDEITGIAFDMGPVSANIVTVPLVTALGIGLASSIKGRHALMDGFGLVGLVALAPRASVQLYGLVVYGSDQGGVEAVATVASDADNTLLAEIFETLFGVVQSVSALLLIVLFFQFVVLRKRLPNPRKIFFGFFLLIIGLASFVKGLRLGLFDIGEQTAFRLAQMDALAIVLVFVFLIGFAATLIEPALLAVAKKAEEEAPDRINAPLLRVLVAGGVGIGIVVGVSRIVLGYPLDITLVSVVLLMLFITLFTPKYMMSLAYDVGGIATSDVTVPLLTVIGIGLARFVEHANPLIDAFGLVALASLFPIIVVMIYATLMEFIAKRRKV